MPPLVWLALLYVIASVVYFSYLRSFLLARRHEKISRELNPQYPTVAVLEFGEAQVLIKTNLNENTEELAYDKIVRVKETREDILLYRHQRLFYHLDKASFTQGTLADFLVFIQGKCPGSKFSLIK